nr:chitinase-like protein 1 [Arenicola marina]
MEVLTSLLRGVVWLVAGVTLTLWVPPPQARLPAHIPTRVTGRSATDPGPYLGDPPPCPCADPALCLPVSRTLHKEVFVFSLHKENWSKYDWNKVTTIVEVGYHDDQLVCFAHSQGVRVVAIANVEPTVLTNATSRDRWTARQVAWVVHNHLDGVNVDFEGEIDQGEGAERAGLTALVTQLAASLRATLTHSQVSFDFAWSPACVDKRCYDYASLASAVDYAFVMAYDERSQILGPCVAGPNSDLPLTQSGLQRYLAMGVPAHKLLLGVPWYGYRYPCLQYQGGVCTIRLVPFRGVNCSDAAGKQFDYNTVTGSFLPLSGEGRQWDQPSQTPYFTYQNATTKQIYQVWYDDPRSLNLKFNVALDLDLGGVGVWEADDLDYNNASQVREMWGAFPY